MSVKPEAVDLGLEKFLIAMALIVFLRISMPRHEVAIVVYQMVEWLLDIIYLDVGF